MINFINKMTLILVLAASSFLHASNSYYGDSGGHNYTYVDKNKADFINCFNQHNQIAYPNKELAENICIKSAERRAQSVAPAQKKCISYFEDAAVEYGADFSSALFCFHIDHQKLSVEDLDKNCIGKALSTAAPYFWTFEDSESISNSWKKDNSNVFKEVLFNCSQRSAIKNLDNPYFKLYSRTVYHTNSIYLIPGGIAPKLGGLSGLVYDANKKEIVAITDEKFNSGLTTFNIVNRNSEPNPWIFEYKNFKKIHRSLIDIEDIVQTSNGNYITTREELVESFESSGTHKSKSYIAEINDRGDFVQDIALPEEFFKKIVEQEYDCPEGAISGFFSAIGRIFSGKKSEPEEVRKCKSRVSVDGIKSNRGIEALALDKEKQILFYAPEQPLNTEQNKQESNTSKSKPKAKDNKSEPEYSNLPFYAHNLQTNEIKKYQYPLQKIYDNGLVAMTYYAPNILITLERYYDPQGKEADVRLYKVDLSGKSEGDTLVKEKLLSLSELRDQFAFGFKKIDNFEGLTVGPKLPNGNQTLILVSDNNLSLRQKTDFLVLEVFRRF